MDELARRYLHLALAIGRLEEGIVDAYYGPPDVRAEAERDPRDAHALADAAADLRAGLPVDTDPQRAHWLDRQLEALEVIARRIAGEEIDYRDEVRRCFDAEPEATPDHILASAHAELDRLLPPGPSLAERSEAQRERLTVPTARLAGVVEWLVAELRQRAARYWPVPAGEQLSVSLVSGQPWAAYNWYDGSLRSRIEIEVSVPQRATDLIALVSHEAFPGHHLEHAWKEQRLVREQDRGEASVQLINTPEAYVSEGLAELGGRMAVDREEWQRLFAEVCRRAGIDLAGSSPEVEWQIAQARHDLRGIGGDAALLLHVDRRSAAEVRQFLVERGLRSQATADKNLAFISHPLWRTYVFCYAGGERLLERWCAAAGDIDAQRQRFFRLLTEQLTPSGLAAEAGI